jgi:hypothetical protein
MKTASLPQQLFRVQEVSPPIDTDENGSDMNVLRGGYLKALKYRRILMMASINFCMTSNSG